VTRSEPNRAGPVTKDHRDPMPIVEADSGATLSEMTDRERAERILREIPGDQMPVALEALQAVERNAQTLRVLRERDPQRSERELTGSLMRIAVGDEAIEQIGSRFGGVDPDEIEREAVGAVRDTRGRRSPTDDE
jgi:hypothetical protein